MAISGSQYNRSLWTDDDYTTDLLTFFNQEIGESTVMFDNRTSMRTVIMDRSPADDESSADVMARIYTNVSDMSVGYPADIMAEMFRVTGTRTSRSEKSKSANPSALLIKKVVSAIRRVYAMNVKEATVLAKAYVRLQQDYEFDDEFMSYYNDVMDAVDLRNL